MKDFIRRILGEELYNFLRSFLSSQSVEYLKNHELIFNYFDLQYLANQQSPETEVTIEQLYMSSPEEARLVLTHQKFGEVDLCFSIKEFLLSAEKSFVSFTYRINNIKPSAQAGLLDKLKIHGASLVVKLFPGTVTKQVFNERDFGEGLKASVFDEVVTLDFHELLKTTPLRQKKFLGYCVLDIIQITDLNIHEKGFGVQLHIFIPEWFKSISLMLVSMVLRRKTGNLPFLPAPTGPVSVVRRLLPF